MQLLSVAEDKLDAALRCGHTAFDGLGFWLVSCPASSKMLLHFTCLV